MELLVTFLLVMARLSAVLMTAPLLGNRAVGKIPRLAIAISLSLIALPLVDASEAPTTRTEIGSAVLSEIIIGALLGMGVAILFAAAQMVGTVISHLAGLQIARPSRLKWSIFNRSEPPFWNCFLSRICVNRRP